jgi:hypothetical protein
MVAVRKHLGRHDADHVAPLMRPFGPFKRPGIFNVLDCLAHPAHKGFGLGQLFVQWMAQGRFLIAGRNRH